MQGTHTNHSGNVGAFFSGMLVLALLAGAGFLVLAKHGATPGITTRALPTAIINIQPSGNDSVRVIPQPAINVQAPVQPVQAPVAPEVVNGGTTGGSTWPAPQGAAQPVDAVYTGIARNADIAAGGTGATAPLPEVLPTVVPGVPVSPIDENDAQAQETLRRALINSGVDVDATATAQAAATQVACNTDLAYGGTGCP